MKAEFEISNAQEQLWEAFAEALRDFLKARSRPDIGGPVGTAGLPERLAMRERDLTSDLESLRQRKAIIETFYAGLTEDQPRAADQLAPARAENLHHLRFCAGVRSRGMRTNCARSSQTASMTTKSLRPPSFSTGSSARSQTKASSNTPVNSRGSGRLPTTATRSTRMDRRMHGVACRPEQDEVNRGAPPRRLPTGASFEQRTCWCPFASLRSGTGPGAELNMKRGNFPFSRVGPTVRIRFPPAASPLRTRLSRSGQILFLASRSTAVLP